MIASFLGTKAGFSADFALVATVVAAILLTIGWRLAVGRRYEAHRWVQTVAVCLNAVPVAFWMIYSFVKYVAPDLPGILDQGSYLLTTIHAVVGAIGVVVGAYVVIRANQFRSRAGTSPRSSGRWGYRTCSTRSACCWASPSTSPSTGSAAACTRTLP